MRDNRHTPIPCPFCGAKRDCSTSIDHDKTPTPNHSIAICLECEQPALFILDANGNLAQREFTEEEYVNLPTEALQGIVQATAFARGVNALRARRER